MQHDRNLDIFEPGPSGSNEAVRLGPVTNLCPLSYTNQNIDLLAAPHKVDVFNVAVRIYMQMKFQRMNTGIEC